MRRLLLLLLLLPLLPACDEGEGFTTTAVFPSGGPFPSEVTAEKKLTVVLDDLHPVQRFDMQLSVEPPSLDARIDAVIRRATLPITWALNGPEFLEQREPADVGSFLQTSATAPGVRLTLAREDFDGVSIAVDVDIALRCPSDVDLDGVDDGVELTIGSLTPVVEEEEE